MIELESYMAPIPIYRNSEAGPRETGKDRPLAVAEDEIDHESSTSFAEEAWCMVRLFAGASELRASEANRRSV